MVIAYFALTTSLQLPFIFHWAIFIQIPFQYKTFFIEFARYGEGAPSMEQPAVDWLVQVRSNAKLLLLLLLYGYCTTGLQMHACMQKKNTYRHPFLDAMAVEQWNHKSHINTNWVNWILRDVLPRAHFAATTVILQVLDNLLLKMWPRCCTAEAVDWAHCVWISCASMQSWLKWKQEQEMRLLSSSSLALDLVTCERTLFSPVYQPNWWPGQSYNLPCWPAAVPHVKPIPVRTMPYVLCMFVSG